MLGVGPFVAAAEIRGVATLTEELPCSVTRQHLGHVGTVQVERAVRLEQRQRMALTLPVSGLPEEELTEREGDRESAAEEPEAARQEEQASSARLTGSGVEA